MTDTPWRNDNTRTFLSDTALFAGLTPTQLDWVVHRSHRRVFEAGRIVMTIEQPGEVVYIMLQGTVKIHIEQGERDVILSILGSGDLLGEMSLIDSVGRSASAVTLENSLLLWMDKASFHYMLDHFPPVARNLVRILTAKVRLSDQMIQALTLGLVTTGSSRPWYTVGCSRCRMPCAAVSIARSSAADTGRSTGRAPPPPAG